MFEGSLANFIISDPVVLGCVFFWMGACLGSFSNVIILRMPEGLSIVTPRSSCRDCKNPVAWFDNIPIVSWIILRGRCRSCKASFSVRYALVELLMGVLFAVVVTICGFNVTTLEYLIFIFCLVTAGCIDLDHMILPDVFTLSGIVVGLVGSLLNTDRTFLSALLGVLMGGGFFWFVAYFYQVVRKAEGLGGGDIKLLAWIGAVLGWQSIPYVILVSSILGSVVGLIVAVKSKAGLKAVIPFGPFLVLGAISFILGGKAIAVWYLRLFFPWL